MASFSDVGKGGTTEANISATIDQVTVDVVGYAHLLSTLAEIHTSLEGVRSSNLEIAAAISKLKLSVSLPPMNPVYNIPEIKVPDIKIPQAQVFSSMKLPSKMLWALASLAFGNILIGVALCLVFLQK